MPKSEHNLERHQIQPTAIKSWLTIDEMSELGRELMKLASDIELSDEPPMDEEAVETELFRRRGGYSDNGE